MDDHTKILLTDSYSFNLHQRFIWEQIYIRIKTQTSGRDRSYFRLLFMMIDYLINGFLVYDVVSTSSSLVVIHSQECHKIG